MSVAKPERLCIEDAAQYLDRPVATLRHWRKIGVGPRSYLILEGRRERVVYDEPDLKAFKALADAPREVRGDVSAKASA